MSINNKKVTQDLNDNQAQSSLPSNQKIIQSQVNANIQSQFNSQKSDKDSINQQSQISQQGNPKSLQKQTNEEFVIQKSQTKNVSSFQTKEYLNKYQNQSNFKGELDEQANIVINNQSPNLSNNIFITSNNQYDGHEVTKTQRLCMEGQIQVNIQSEQQKSEQKNSGKSSKRQQQQRNNFKEVEKLNIQSQRIKVNQWISQSCPQKFPIKASKKQMEAKSNSPNRQQFKTGQFGIRSSNPKNTQNQTRLSKCSSNGNSKDRKQQLEQIFHISGIKVNFDKETQFMDQKQFMRMNQKFKREENDQQIDQIQKKSDDSHNKSAIDLINQAFGGSKELNKIQYNRNRSSISSADKRGRQNDFDLNTILNQKVMDTNNLKASNQIGPSVQSRNSQNSSNLFNNIAKNLNEINKPRNSESSKKQHLNFLDLLVMQTAQNQFQTHSQTQNFDFKRNIRKGSQDQKGSSKMAFTMNQNWLPSVISIKNSHNKIQQLNNFKKTKDSQKVSEVAPTPSAINNLTLQENNKNSNQFLRVIQSKTFYDGNKNGSLVYPLQKKPSIITNPPVIDLMWQNEQKKYKNERQGITMQDQGFLSKSIIVKGSDPFEESLPNLQHHQSHIQNNASQSRISNISNKNKTNFGVSNFTGVTSNINYSRSEGPITFSQNFQQVVPCNQSHAYNRLQKVSHKNKITEIKMDKHQIIHKSFFMPNYVMYHIQVFYQEKQVQRKGNLEDVLGMQFISQKRTPNSKIIKDLIVKRNYQDFQRFRAILQKQYPGFHLPYLQSNSWISETNIDFVRRQKSMLQLFLNDLIRNPYIQNSQLLHDFLTTEDHKSFKRKIEQYQKGKIVPPTKSIQELILPQNQILVKLTEQQKIFCDHFTPYLDSMSMSFEKLNDLYDNLTNALENAAINMNSISELLKSMGKRTRNFNTRVATSGCEYKITDSLPCLLDNMSESYKIQFQTLKSRRSLIVNGFLPLVKYENSNISSFKKLISLRNQFTDNYLKRINEEAKQLQSYPSQNVGVYLGERCHYGKSGLLIEQSRDILVYKYQTAFFNTQVCTEGMRLFAQTTAKIDNSWKELVKKQRQKLNQEKVQINKVVKQQEISA